MTGLPDNNGNDFIRGLETRACVNGMTKSDVERLKNALVKKILDDETVIDVTEDGSIVADSNGMFLSVNGQVLGLSVDGEDVIPVTEPYLPEDENENPLAPPNNTIMTSANIAVDPRIVHTTGNEISTGIKQGDFRGYVLEPVRAASGKWTRFCSISTVDSHPWLIEFVDYYANNVLAYAKAFVGGAGAQRTFKIIGERGIANDVIVVTAYNNVSGEVEIWMKGSQGVMLTQMIITSLYGKIPSDKLTIINTFHDNLFVIPDVTFSNPVYILGSASI